MNSMNVLWNGRLARKLAFAAMFAMATLGLATATTGAARAADEAPTIRFGVPTWPGVTVKSEIAAQLLETMGYQTMQTNASPAFALNSLKTDDLDIYLGGWMPTEKHMIDPLAEEGSAEVLTTNISGAIMGIAVPEYVWEAGVHTEADLAEHADKFNSTIYGIEPGSGFNDAIQSSIDNNRHGLGDWQMTPSSTSAMLTQVGRAIDREEWIVFLGWEPHWMNVTYDIRYLESVGEPKIAETKSDVLTVANPKTVADHPDFARFFRQYQVSNNAQSEWVLEYSYKEREASEVAAEWVGNNLDTVAGWLEGVKTRDGGAAIDAVRAEYGG